ncbi:hypothetical protein ACVW0P_000679 [Mucilaginibacter sp. UYNi724]
MKSFTEDNILELTGILGLHNTNEKHKGFTYQLYTPEGKKVTSTDFSRYKKFVVDIQSPYVIKMYRLIDFEKKTINNLKLISSKIEHEIGKKSVKSQVNFGIQYGFTTIDLIAARSYEKIDLGNFKFLYDGYKKWGKIGFLMWDINEQFLFSTLMRNAELDFKDLTSLYTKARSGEELIRKFRGQDIWNSDGFTWKGRFHINNKSTCFSILHDI